MPTSHRTLLTATVAVALAYACVRPTPELPSPDALAQQVLLDDVGAALGQALVVRIGSGRVGVPHDQQPESRILLQELTFYSSGKQAATFHGIRKRLIDGVEAMVRRAQEDKTISAREGADLIARHIFFVYSASLRWWIAAPEPDPDKGIADLRRLLKLQFDGLR